MKDSSISKVGWSLEAGRYRGSYYMEHAYSMKVINKSLID